MIARFGVVTGIVLKSALDATSFAHAQSSTLLQCAGYRWTRPRLLVTDSVVQPAVARYPSTVVTSKGTYVVGNNVPFFVEDALPRERLFAVELGRGRIGRPAGDFLFVLPRALAAPDGKLQLLWAEPTIRSDATMTAMTWPPRELSAIWASTYARGTGWSKPKRVYEGSRIHWDRAGIADGDASDSLPALVVAPEEPLANFGNTALLFLRSGRRGWTTTSVQPNSSIAYSSVARRGGRVWLAYIAADYGVPEDQNSVFVERSLDTGRHWLSPVLISRSGSNPAHDIKILAGRKDEVHAVWRREFSSGPRLQHVSSHDGGVTWSTPDDIAIPSKSFGLKADIDKCGTIHVLYEDAHGGEIRIHIDHAAWNGGWTRVTHLFPHLRSNSPDFLVSSSGRAILTFLAQSASAPLASPISSFFSEIMFRP